jgi:YVTN family beta-propeller protein
VSRNPRRLSRLVVALLLCAGAALGGSLAPSAVATAPAHLGPDLLLNGDAGVGAVSVQGWDAVTIPGWSVLSGLPTVVRSGTPGFPRTRSSGVVRLFAGGAGGTSLLEQSVSLRSPRGGQLPRGTRYQLSAELGGTNTSAASITVWFSSSTRRALGRGVIGPVGKGVLSVRSVSGQLPPGAVSGRLVLRLATSVKNVDGANAPTTGYNRAAAAAISLRLTASTQRARRRPPVAHVPHFAHVFLFMFENQDFGAVIGNRKRAPFLNSLLPRSSLLADMFAEEHPSDGNYLALAAGGVFGIPLTDPLEENPQYTVNATNIGDLIDKAHETWKAYLQSAAGPCDDTVHRYYWNDDLPFLYFADVRNRPAYCAAHLPPLDALQSDLASAATTPNFVWIGPDDCSDMEGCGVRAGDTFLKRELEAILGSPAWRTQRSLAIITFDEDGYDHEHPAQRIPTLILGSGGVRAGYVSHIRYTHYSLLRTIEAALGLGTLTDNDLYAQPLNDVFDARLAKAVTLRAPLVPAGSAAAAMRRGRRSVVAGSRPRTSSPSATAFVANSASASVTPVSLSTHRAANAIRVGSDPEAIAATPDGRSVYVVSSGTGTVTPIDAATRKPEPPIRVGNDPTAIALTPDGATAYVVNTDSDTVTPIDTATDTAGTPIPVGLEPRSIAVTPDGKTAYVLDWGGAAVTPIDLATGRTGPPIPVGAYPSAIAINANGSVAYVANYGSDTVTPIVTADNRPRDPIPVGEAPNALAVTPDGSAVDVVTGNTDSVDPIAASTGTRGRPIRVGYSPVAIAVVGPTAYVVNTISGTVTPVSTTNGSTSKPISVGTYSYPTAIAIAPDDRIAAVVDTYSGQLSLVDLRHGRAAHPITVGSFPVAVAIAG